MCEQITIDNQRFSGEMEIKKALTLKEIQDILHIGTNSAYALIHSNSFPVIRIGRSYRIPAEPFYDWLNHSNAVIH